ncbi:MAG: Lrp/AsnC family transcriptional regulator [Candidatus Baldrarchaeia archaeon]
MTLDHLDKRLIELLTRDGRLTLTEIGRILGISHVAAGKRLRSLINRGIIKVGAQLNLKKMGIKIAVIMAEVESNRKMLEIAERFSKCPRMLLLCSTTGRYNLLGLMIAENIDTLESVVNTCAFRTYEGIRKSEVHVTDMIFHPEFFPLMVISEKKEKTPPCGADCGNCERYKNNKCLACPLTVFYKGPI